MARELTQRQRAFLAAYLGEARGVGIKAARLAGYRGTEHYLRTIASKLVTNGDIAAAIAEANARLEQEGIGNKEQRVRAQQERWDKMLQVIQARGAEYAQAAPGADTGLLVRTFKQVGRGEDARVLEEWAVDTGLLAELRQLEQLTAKELGQVIERSEVTGKNGGAIVIRRYVGIDPDDV